MDKQSKKTIFSLTLAQATLGSQMPMYIILGGLVGQSLSENSCYATLPITLIIIGSMLSSPLLSTLMQATNRRLGLLIGNISGFIGSLISSIAIYFQSFELFLFGSFVSGTYMASQAFYRFAATDYCEDQFKAKAISIVLSGGLIAAILGPTLVKMSMITHNPVPLLYPYLAIVILNCLGPFILFHVRPTSVAKIEKERIESLLSTEKMRINRPLLTILKNPTILVSISCSMIAYSVMNLVMTASPIAIVGCGFGTNQAANVVSAHALAMFIPSFFTGKLIEKYGEKLIIGSGMILFLIAIFTAFQGINIWNFYYSLILIGIGWNFGFIGSTSLITKHHYPLERGKVQGLNDFFVFGFVALSSVTSGWLMNCSSNSSQLGWQVINLTVAPLTILGLMLIIFLWAFNEKKYGNS